MCFGPRALELITYLFQIVNKTQFLSKQNEFCVLGLCSSLKIVNLIYFQKLLILFPCQCSQVTSFMAEVFTQWSAVLSLMQAKLSVLKVTLSVQLMLRESMMVIIMIMGLRQITKEKLRV